MARNFFMATAIASKMINMMNLMELVGGSVKENFRKSTDLAIFNVFVKFITFHFGTMMQNSEMNIGRNMNKTPLVDQENDPVLTTREAASLLGVSVSTAQLWIESGAIASWKTPGGHRRVRLSAVKRLLEEQGKATGTAKPPDAVLSEEFVPAQAPAYPVAANEAERLRVLAASHLIDSPPEMVFDRLTRLATQITQAPIALISLLTSKRQWFKSHEGIDAAETPREWAFCSYAILDTQPFIVEDARADDRFRENPLVTGEPHIRFYAGFPLITKNDVRLGTLCIIDREPRQLTAEQIQSLQELSNIASEEISRRV